MSEEKRYEKNLKRREWKRKKNLDGENCLHHLQIIYDNLQLFTVYGSFTMVEELTILRKQILPARMMITDHYDIINIFIYNNHYDMINIFIWAYTMILP